MAHKTHAPIGAELTFSDRHIRLGETFAGFSVGDVVTVTGHGDVCSTRVGYTIKEDSQGNLWDSSYFEPLEEAKPERPKYRAIVKGPATERTTFGSDVYDIVSPDDVQGNEDGDTVIKAIDPRTGLQMIVIYPLDQVSRIIIKERPSA